MKLNNAILSIATTLSGLNNNSYHAVDAKIWTLRGIGRSPATIDDNNNDVIHSESLMNEEDHLQTPSANLGGLFKQGERTLGGKKKDDSVKEEVKTDAVVLPANAAEEKTGETKAPTKAPTVKGKEGGTTAGSNLSLKGKETTTVTVAEAGDSDAVTVKKAEKTEKKGAEIMRGAPGDVVLSASTCDDQSVRFRRKLKGGDGKEKKHAMETGICNSCTIVSPDPEEDAVSGLNVAVETSDDQTCDPDEEGPCEDKTGAGEDPTTTVPSEGEEVTLMEDATGAGQNSTTTVPPEMEVSSILDENGTSQDPTTVSPEMEVSSNEIGAGQDPRTTVPPEADGDLLLNMDEEVERHRRLTGVTNTIGNFKKLSCNPVEFVCTGAAGLSTVMGTGEVKVPCGTCLLYDLGPNVTIAGLNIVGKLKVPMNYKSTLKTPYVFVQGELEMSDDKTISEDNTSMKIILTGNTDVMFKPEEPITGIASSLNAGVKPFLVAGGKLNIRAWNQQGGGKTWTPLLSMAEADRPHPAPIKALQPLPHKSDPSKTCPSSILHDFEAGYDGAIWSGGEGGILTFDGKSGTLTETNLYTNWQGFRLDFTKFILDCPLRVGVDYLVTIRLKIEDKSLPDGALTSCESTGTKCPRMGRRIVYPTTDSNFYKPLSRGVIGRNNEWFTFATTWSWTEDELKNNVGMIFYLDQFTSGNVIHLDEFQFELPSPKSFPPEDDPCLELVTNGDAEDTDGRGWHHYPMWTHDQNKYTPVIKEETLADGSVNKYWHIGYRNWIGDSLRFNVNPACLALNNKYTLSLRVRFSGKSSHSTRYWFEIKGTTQKNGFRYNKPLYCPQQSPADGWVTCSGELVVTDDYVFTSKPEIIFVTMDEGNVPVENLHLWDYDDVSIRFKSGPVEGLEIDAAAATRWGNNSDVHITSSTLHGKDSQNGRVVAITPKTNGTVVLKLDQGINTVLSEKDTPGQGVEIAVLTRNIKIIGENDGTVNGGYLQIFHTPGVAQVIEGVELLNMGQLARKNRFAMQLLYNGDIKGTSLSRNSIRQSNMRCISIDGTSNATIAENIGAGISGHCFYFSHQSSNNMVIGNLASNMDDRVNWNNRIPGFDDYDADGFSIWSPSNHFIGNVAAGGHKRGFRYYSDWQTLGEDLKVVGSSMRQIALGTFKDNKAHSNFRQGFHFSDLEQFFQFRDPENNVPLFENLSAYRNREQGIYAWNVIHAKFIKGFLSDNQKGIELRRMDGITVEDFVIQGQTEIFKNHTGSRDKLCGYSGWTYEGLNLMGALWRYGDTDPGTGLRLKNVVFLGFDKEKEYYPTCPSTEPIGMSSDTNIASHFDYKTSFLNVTIKDKRGMILDGCRASSYGFPDIVINDLDGSLDPDKNAASGALVSDKEYMTTLLGGCKPFTGCMAYCAEVCLNMFAIYTERFGTEKYKLRVTDTSSGISVEIPGNALDVGERGNTYAYEGQRVFSASLPAGEYTAEFVDELGNLVWPTYAEEQWARPADCAGGVSVGSVTLIKPGIDTVTGCAELIRNGASVNRTETKPWIHTKWYSEKAIEVRPGLGKDGGNAVATYQRQYHWTGIAQNLNSLCTDVNEGEFYEFNAWVKMTDFNGVAATNIDVNREWWRNQSPILTINSRKYRDETSKQYLYNVEIQDVAAVVRPYNKDQWSRIHGIFKMPTSQRIFIEIERAPDKVELILDSASLTPFSCNRESLVSNGRLETNDTRFWDTWGGDVVIDVVPGPDGLGNALKSSGRPYTSHTQAQVLNTDCVKAGERIGFSAKIKVDGGGLPDCNPYTWDGATRCPDIMLHTNKAELREYWRVASVTADTPENGWYYIHGIHALTSNQEKADLTKIYFGDANTGWNIYTADVQASVIEQNCHALILNPDMEERDLFWTYTDRDRSKIKVITPGSGGTGHALRVYSRDHAWRGFRQMLDARCFVSGAELTINAKFRLTDASLKGVSCDPNYQYNSNEGQQCPSVVIYGKKCVGGDLYWQFWNSLSDKTWSPESWNNYEATFDVNDQLASCSQVDVYIHQVNKNWNIEIDDVQISEKSTLPPSLSPTLAPTDDVVAETLSPTKVPTGMPTLATVTKCPPVGQYIELFAGPVMLERSSTLCIITKANVDSGGIQSEIAPVARSFNGGDWEKHAGDFAEALLYGQQFGDYVQGCQINLPELAPGQKYFITSYIDSAARRLNTVDEEKRAVARLLEQATFGTTLTDLNDWTKGPVTKETAAEWVKEQMAMPATSHRQFFRERTNPRLTNPVRIGRNNHPCSANSRWRTFTFSRKDGDLWWFPQTFKAVYNSASDYHITITLNGFVRTTVKSISFEDLTKTFEFNKEYLMCNLPQEKVDGWFWLKLDDGSCTHLRNPLVAFSATSSQPAYVLNLPNISGSLQVIDEELSNGQELISTVGLDDELCKTLSGITEEGDAPIHGRLPDGSYVLFDPRLDLQENTIEHPEPDGGGLIRTLTGDIAKCANVPRTFLNEDSCVLSYSATACGSSEAPRLQIELNAENIGTLYDLTGQYVYSILGLPVVDTLGKTLESPCTPGLRSRWEIKAAAECNATALGAKTNSSLAGLLAGSSDLNAHVRDIIFPVSGFTCDKVDEPITKVEIIIGSSCFKRVHPEHMSVFDFTYWSLNHTHPGNMVAMMGGRTNPIKKWRDEEASAFLIYPSFPDSNSFASPHPIERWNTYNKKFPKLGRFGDLALFVDLPNELRTDDVAEHFGETSAQTGSGVVTCGSPGEVANVPSLGNYFVQVHEKSTDWGLDQQKLDVWFHTALFSPDQLRQRVAFALSHILVVVPGAIGVSGDHSEAFLAYHDIFVRNAFGSYRDILKEVSYNPLMAENLSFLQSKSTAHMWEFLKKHAFADENYGREIMQLFSTGLYLLNKDGSHKKDQNGRSINAYSNDEIMSFARIWTGFDYQQGRGNVEENTWFGNRVDPMRIEASWRDKFPKSDMTGGYIGDGYPLCVDLPEKMWLRRGAKYRLLGAKKTPELMEDDPAYKNDLTMKNFVLEANSPLKQALCNSSGGSGKCQYAMTVTLQSNLVCFGKECNADTLRVVDVGEGIFYEYVSPACVEQAFYRDAKKVIYKDRMRDSSCANPHLPYASEACCSTADVAAYRSPNYLYDQERVTFLTAGSRCEAMGKSLCDFNYISNLDWHKKGYHWTSDSCKIQVKVDSVGQAALVYKPNSYNHLHPHIDQNNRNFFKVYWEDDYPRNDIDGPNGNNCGYGACQSLETGGCLCDTTVSESRVFSGMPRSVEEVLSKLSIGAYDIQAYDEGTYEAPKTENNVTAYLKTGEGYGLGTVFEVFDENRRLLRFKNSVGRVRIQGNSSFAFRNAPSFMSVLNTESTAGKAAHETDAALDHYFFHPNTAPFLAIRLIQRMVTSNPSPKYVKAVADAFTNGRYMDIGSGDYGDMAAMVAAVLLEPQARDLTIDRDPFDGMVIEPVLQITRLSRGMEITAGDTVKMVYFDGLKDKIGESPYEYSSVFSFFLPEYRPDAATKAGQATLLAPEVMALDAPKTVGLLNGMFSLVKFGLSNCYRGLNDYWANCNENDDFSSSYAHLTYKKAWIQPQEASLHATAVVNELSLILTADRLSSSNREIIKTAYLGKLTTLGHSAALRLAVQLIVTTPEFHTSQTVITSGQARSEPPQPRAFGQPEDYKAIVMVMLAGGADSFNMLVPHTCTGAKDMYQEYKDVRLEVALQKEKLIELNAVSNQVCEKFGVHPKYVNVADMFNKGDLSWFANTGQLDAETNKYEYWQQTVTELFAHNWMQLAAQQVDPHKMASSTGILGRIRDAAKKQGRQVGAFSVDWSSAATSGFPGVNPSAEILNRNGVALFNEKPSTSNMLVTIKELNRDVTPESGVFSDLWADHLTSALATNQKLYDTLSAVTTDTPFPNEQLSLQLEVVAKMIKARDGRGVDGDLFYCTKGGFDTHTNTLMNTDKLFGELDAAYGAFRQEMMAMGIWDQVVLINVSEFARTLNVNGNAGVDHAWGGNYAIMGGAVKGGQIHGSYPENLTDDGERMLVRGRAIPTHGWEAVFKPMAEWFGVDKADLPEILPNMGSFAREDYWIPSAEVFSMA